MDSDILSFCLLFTNNYGRHLQEFIHQAFAAYENFCLFKLSFLCNQL